MKLPHEQFHTRHSPPGLNAMIFGGVLIFLSVLLLLGGIWFVAVGGSTFYVLAGLAMAISGTMVLQGRALGLWLFLSAVVSATIWAITEVGLSWGLMLRVIVSAALALWAVFLVPSLSENPRLRSGNARNAFLRTGLVVIVGTVTVLAILVSRQDTLGT